MSDDRTPIVIGVGQRVQRDDDPREALGPLAMLEQVARQAARDAQAGDAILCELDAIALLDVFGGGREMQNAPRLLDERLGARAKKEYVGEIGGQIGVPLANFVAERIAKGEVRLALIAGSNNLRARRGLDESDLRGFTVTGGLP